jgi:hypothetical protein
MARVVLATGLARWLDAGVGNADGELTFEVEAGSLRAALESAFSAHPTLRGYVVDESGTVRQHVAVFVDGQSIADKSALDVALGPRTEIYIMQALSGG